MSRKRVVNGLLAVLLISTALLASSVLKLRAEQKAQASRRIDTSIIRLHSEQGRFFCSGTVISNHRILTAAHCVVQDFGFFAAVISKVQIRTQDGAIVGWATVEAANPRQDLAIVRGEFTKLDKREVMTNTTEINEAFLRWPAKVRACGFPDAGPLRCSDISRIDRENFSFAGRGGLYPGMSGGPVFDLRSGKVMAVNTAVQGNRVILSPLIELYNQLGINESSDK